MLKKQYQKFLQLDHVDLVFTNEALDAAKEELQSTNEQLNAVNEELHERNEELVRSNNDLVNVFRSVQLAIVLLDRQGKIRRFTPMAESVLNLISGDTGRPFNQIKPNIDCPELDRLITDVLNGEMLPPLKVQDTQGRWFSLAIRPYQDIHHRIDGVVLTLRFDETKWQE